MIAAIINAFRVPEIRKKILFSALMLLVYRLGSYIPVPGVDASKVFAEFQKAAGTGGTGILSLLDMFAGGSLSRMTLFALNVGPYITSSIVMELLKVVIPKLEELSKEGDEGRKKLQAYSRYMSLALAVLQSVSYMLLLKGAMMPGIWNNLLVIVSMTAGAMFTVWLGEMITEKGIGNGISLIIFTGIVSRLPMVGTQLFSTVKTGGLNILLLILFLIVSLAVIVGVVAIEEANRKIPVQYPKRVVGRRVYGGQSTHLPIKVNQAGVIPVIFASSLLAFPATIGSFWPAFGDLMNKFTSNVWAYNSVQIVLIIAFTYFYTSITFNPIEISNNMKQYGGFIPGYRPGKPTAEYIDRVVTRISLPGALFLGFMAILPSIMTALLGFNIGFGGTSIIIAVGVALDTMKQIESQLIMRQYEGFMQ
ncbi:MAG TPA: preprotein translocase subunit SecY [Bacillota bacterium]|nr:preprotein translocase subunit SecY [Bacillota bacterium]HOH10989.1 preprotein translocase subunit SecY [Bacillota bacterium]HOS50049.1 preprotein translocase subunit SecY [Bacillota bacterium]HOY89400.1 preprotein translocase subunit SecY [Bacillota bacterium]HPM64157.1 preprotein translocase subunit SecY [Bacillota bacterium]